MKLKNKKTGEIKEAEAREDGIYLYDETTEQWYKYELSLLAECWEYYQEPKEYWYIDERGLVCCKRLVAVDNTATKKEIGNYFSSKEEAERAVECLRAWKRLRDKGFRFDGWEDLSTKMTLDDFMPFTRDVIDTDNVIGFRMDDYHDCIGDLDILFNEEEK